MFIGYNSIPGTNLSFKTYCLYFCLYVYIFRVLKVELPSALQTLPCQGNMMAPAYTHFYILVHSHYHMRGLSPQETNKNRPSHSLRISYKILLNSCTKVSLLYIVKFSYTQKQGRRKRYLRFLILRHCKGRWGISSKKVNYSQEGKALMIIYL